MGWHGVACGMWHLTRRYNVCSASWKLTTLQDQRGAAAPGAQAGAIEAHWDRSLTDRLIGLVDVVSFGLPLETILKNQVQRKKR